MQSCFCLKQYILFSFWWFLFLLILFHGLFMALFWLGSQLSFCGTNLFLNSAIKMLPRNFYESLPWEVKKTKTTTKPNLNPFLKTRKHSNHSQKHLAVWQLAAGHTKNSKIVYWRGEKRSSKDLCPQQGGKHNNPNIKLVRKKNVLFCFFLASANITC